MEHVRWLAEPTATRPTVIAAFTGWNDAGDAASSGVRHLVESWGATALAEIDPEEFTDFATVRPHVRITDGRRHIVWPTVGVWHASTPGGDVLLVLGPEPAMRWRLFTEQLLGIVRRVDARMVLTLGALLADVPHSRPVQLVATGTETSVIERHRLQTSRYQGPTGIVGALQDACGTHDVDSISLWAAVPAYASNVPSPKAMLALIERACDLIGTPAPIGELAGESSEYESRIDALVEDDDDLASYVERIERMYDTGDIEDEDDDRPINAPVDSDALVAEVERFLRDREGGS
jgi:predicted ATP-grasp superfamily ATP-dependent carboligase